MKILLSGASGLLGKAILSECVSKSISCDAFDRSKIVWKGNHGNVKLLDGYDTFIHAAANTNVEQCENNVYECYRDNAFLTEKLVNAAQLENVKFVFISSTGVYGNKITHRPYHEYDIAKPATQHHKAKFFAENYLSQVLNNYLILRTGWLFGGGRDSNDFISKIISSIKNTRGEMKSNHQQMGSPTFVDDVARCLLMLIDQGERGLFNLVNEGIASRYLYVKTIAELYGANVEVLPVDAINFKRVAPVSDNESAINLKLQMAGYPPMPSWEDSLRTYMSITYE